RWGHARGLLGPASGADGWGRERLLGSIGARLKSTPRDRPSQGQNTRCSGWFRARTATCCFRAAWTNGPRAWKRRPVLVDEWRRHVEIWVGDVEGLLTRTE